MQGGCVTLIRVMAANPSGQLVTPSGNCPLVMCHCTENSSVMCHCTEGSSVIFHSTKSSYVMCQSTYGSSVMRHMSSG